MEKHCFHLIQGISKDHECLVHAYDSKSESKFSFFFKLKANIKQILSNNEDIDVIYLNDGLMVAFTLWLKQITKIPVVATFHGLDVLFPLWIYQKLILPKFKYLSKMIAVSEHTADALRDRNMPRQNICVIKNGVDINPKQDVLSSSELDIFQKKFLDHLKGKKILLMVGRPVKRKGMSWFLDKVVRRLEDSYHVMIAGSFDKKPSGIENVVLKLPRGLQKYINLFLGLPDDKIDIRRFSNEASLQPKVSLLPRLSDAELNFIYQSSNAFIMPNIKVKGDAEGFGLVALEASVNGLPVFCSGIEGIKDAIINGKNGVHVESQNAEDWINTLAESFSNIDLLEQNALTCRNFTQENFSWQKMTGHYESVFASVLDHQNSKSANPNLVLSIR